MRHPGGRPPAIALEVLLTGLQGSSGVSRRSRPSGAATHRRGSFRYACDSYQYRGPAICPNNVEVVVDVAVLGLTAVLDDDIGARVATAAR